MTSTSAAPAATGAEHVRWNLADLYADLDALDADLQQADAEAARFADTYRDRLADLDPETMAAAMHTLEGIHDRLGRAYTYAYLNWSTNTEDAERGALLQRVREAYTHASQKLIFFDVEWARMDDERATALLGADALAPYRHHLELQRLRREHVLSEGEERVLSEKAVTGNAA